MIFPLTYGIAASCTTVTLPVWGGEVMVGGLGVGYHGNVSGAYMSHRGGFRDDWRLKMELQLKYGVPDLGFQYFKQQKKNLKNTHT